MHVAHNCVSFKTLPIPPIFTVIRHEISNAKKNRSTHSRCHFIKEQTAPAKDQFDRAERTVKTVAFSPIVDMVNGLRISCWTGPLQRPYGTWIVRPCHARSPRSQHKTYLSSLVALACTIVWVIQPTATVFHFNNIPSVNCRRQPPRKRWKTKNTHQPNNR